MSTHTQDEFAITCMREASRTHQYLLGQRLVTRNLALPTFIVAHASDHAKLRTEFVDTEKLSFELLGLDALATKARFKSPLPDSHCDALFAHQLITHTPKAQFAPAADRKLYRLTQMRVGLQLAAAAILFGCLLASTRLGLQWSDARERTASTNAQTAADSKRHQALIDELPKIKLTPDNLRAVMARYDEIVQRSGGAVPLLAHLSNALEALPTITLQRLEWTLAERATAGAAAGGNPPKVGVAPAAPGGVTKTLEITANLPITMASDQRRQLETVDELVTKLTTDSVSASIIKSPVDVESGKSLKRGAAETARPSGPPEFKILLTTSAL